MASTRRKKERDQLDLMLDQFDLKGLSREEVLGQDGLLKQLTGRMLSRIMETEMDEHLGYVGLKSANIPMPAIIRGITETDIAKRRS